MGFVRIPFGARTSSLTLVSKGLSSLAVERERHVESALPWVGASGDVRMWATVYASVDDVERCLARAGELGGEREYGPLDVDDHMQTGAIRDPAGNVFGVYHHAPH